MKQKHPLRRIILGSLAVAVLAAPVAGAGCGAGFAPISQVDSLRVLGVVADKPYAQPGENVTFTMTYDDRSKATPLIVWLGRCFDPIGDEYFGCYQQLGAALGGFDPSHLPPGVGFGDTFTLTLPEDIISRRPMPTGNIPYYGIAFVFFAVCDGTLQPVQPEGTGLAGSFPIGCFDSMGNRLGADRFVPGYTQVYAFADGRTNQNPRVVTDDGKPGNVGGIIVEKLDVNDDLVSGGAVGPGDTVDSCFVSEADRQLSGCGRTDPYQVCTQYQITVDVPDDVAELDPSTTDMNNNPLHEVVWVDYFADRGDVDNPILLVSDATLGIQRGTDGLGNPQDQFATKWIAPPSVLTDAGPVSQTVNIWAVVHDSRGGETVVTRRLTVQ
jgi:hypothetical protein